MTDLETGTFTPTGTEGAEQFPKPAEGSWTESFGLDTGPVSFLDSYDPEFYQLEREAVFKRSWLHLGRVEELPRKGSYFTRELSFLGYSILVVRGMDDQIRAFHNVCSHRGNKLIWDEHPKKEAKGICRALACKYHGWRFNLDGQVSYVHNAPEFFNLDPAKLKLPEVHLEVWAGFIFINLSKAPAQNLRDFLTPAIAKLDTYPFHKMTQRYVFESTIKSNWKLFMDAFQEVYHNPFVHGKLNDPNLPQTGVDKIPTMVPYFAGFGKHRLFTSGGPMANVKVRKPRPADEMFGANFYGPLDVPDVGPLGDALNPGGIKNWGLDSWKIYPNFDIITWGRNWFITYQYWPVDVGTNRFVWTVNFTPPRNARDRLAQEHCLITTREFLIQDANTLEATQQMIASGVRDDYYICDQEVAVRHFHKAIQDDVEAYRHELQRKEAEPR